MKLFLTCALFALMATACTKKEEVPAPAPTPEVAPAPPATPAPTPDAANSMTTTTM